MTHNIGPVLEHYGMDYNPDRTGNQQVRCAFHEDRHASASVNLDEGVFNCFTCGIAGDAIEIIKLVEGVEFREARRIAEGLAGEDRTEVSRGADPGGSYLPRRQGHRPGRNRWVSPWVRKRA